MRLQLLLRVSDKIAVVLLVQFAENEIVWHGYKVRGFVQEQEDNGPLDLRAIGQMNLKYSSISII